MKLGLKLAILAAGKTQRQVAAESKIVSENKLSEIVRGWSEPSQKEKRALARVLKQPVAVLFQQDTPRMSRPDTTNAVERVHRATALFSREEQKQ